MSICSNSQICAYGDCWNANRQAASNLSSDGNVPVLMMALITAFQTATGGCPWAAYLVSTKTPKNNFLSSTMTRVSPCVSQSRLTFAFAFACEVGGSAGVSDSKLGTREEAADDSAKLGKLCCARNSLGANLFPIGSLWNWNLQLVGGPTGAIGGWSSS